MALVKKVMSLLMVFIKMQPIGLLFYNISAYIFVPRKSSKEDYFSLHRNLKASAWTVEKDSVSKLGISTGGKIRNYIHESLLYYFLNLPYLRGGQTFLLAGQFLTERQYCRLQHFFFACLSYVKHKIPRFRDFNSNFVHKICCTSLKFYYRGRKNSLAGLMRPVDRSLATSAISEQKQ